MAPIIIFAFFPLAEPDELFAKSEKLPPKDESSWTPLHYLQNAIMSKSKIMITDENKVEFLKDDKVYPFDEITNFQASEPLVTPPGFELSSLPFYTLGTLAYLMQCKGVKYSAYVQVYIIIIFMSRPVITITDLIPKKALLTSAKCN